MEYQNTDEAIRREACEQVKQIVKVIKAIKIKYYLNFSKISDKDNTLYKKLEANLNQISENHKLDSLKVELMQEVEAKYDGKDVKDMKSGGSEQKPDNILQACYGAIDAQKEALSRGKISQALRCQQQLKIYMKELEESGCKEVLNYKREKFAELMQTREQVENQVNSWNNTFKGMYKIKHVTKRKRAMDKIINIQNKAKEQKEQDEVLVK